MDSLNNKILGKISGDFNDPEAFKKKIDSAKEVREYANANISVNI